MCDPTSSRTTGLDGGHGGLARVRIGRILGCLVASCCLSAGLSSCEALFGSSAQTQQPQASLLAVSTPQPTPSFTPTISAGDASRAAQKATEAAEKARIASSKAAAASQEAARASAEASQAAAEAVLAVKLSQGSSTKKVARKTARHSFPNQAATVSSPASSPSPIATSSNQEKLAAVTSADVSSSSPPSSNLVSAANAAQDQSIQTETARLIDQTGSSLRKIARDKLSSQDAERYDVASKLLKNARDSFAAQDFIAAHSLANKAAVLIRPLQAATEDK